MVNDEIYLKVDHLLYRVYANDKDNEIKPWITDGHLNSYLVGHITNTYVIPFEY